MPKGLQRFHHPGDWRFIPCSCYPHDLKLSLGLGKLSQLDRRWGDSLDPTRFRMLQTAAGANDLGNSDHGAIVAEPPVKSSMEEQAQEQTHSVFSSKAGNDYHFKTGQCEIPTGHGTSGVPVTHG